MNVNVKVDLSNYATKTDMKNVSHVDVSSFAPKPNLASLKTEADKLDIDKLTLVPVDLSKLSDGVKNDIVKKTEYNKLVAILNNIDTAGFVLQTTYDADKSSLATNLALTAVENKIPDVSSLVKKTNYDTKLSDIEKKIAHNNHDKYITAQEFNKLITDNKLNNKTDFDVKLARLSKKDYLK